MKMKILALFVLICVTVGASELRDGERCGMLHNQLATTRSKLEDIERQLQGTSRMRDFSTWNSLASRKQLLQQQYLNIREQQNQLDCF